MRIPTIRGIIDRRILANFRIDPNVMSARLPPPFRPKLANGFAVGGICLIRLKAVRPRLIPLPCGIGSENAAHRMAVEWDEQGRTRQGVYIPRRDTNSRLNTFAGGTVFRGTYHHAMFTVHESDDHYSIALQSDDERTRIRVAGRVTDHLPAGSVFTCLNEASAFFEQGALGYSATGTPGRFDGLELKCQSWHVEPLEIEHIESNYFQNSSYFPPGSTQFDCALLMRNIHHEWHG